MRACNNNNMHTNAQVSETVRTGAAAGHSRESGREPPPQEALPLQGPHPSLHLLLWGYACYYLLHPLIPCLAVCPRPLSCCIYIALIPCLAAYILPSSPVLLYALVPCLAAYILPSSPVLLHIYCPHPLSCCIYTTLIPYLAAYILPSSPALLHIYCTCFCTAIPTSFNILFYTCC